ncbi:DUF4291 domain-containing protein [Hydrocoleum sp. CS-953]|uniref:DUF4291 domain-containing protein n=1 Tax=Hydrocoleum sp. CS-953 TaxID=1671698 RepID=UPI001FEDFD21|nr:DUF4291 domain-containing protein [Hydrocoleum sp. CS-953]
MQKLRYKITLRLRLSYMQLVTENYLTQVSNWPEKGKHILAQFDENSIVVYQAYKPKIGRFAALKGYFGGEFSLSRMSWIKPNFLWIIYRSGWGTKTGQEIILAVTIKRTAFDEILANAVDSKFIPTIYNSQEEWKETLKRSPVRLQWDPDHNPMGGRLERRAIQLGLRGETLKNYSRDWIIKIEDITEFVRQQRSNRESSKWINLITPREDVYPVDNSEIIYKLGLSIL